MAIDVLNRQRLVRVEGESVAAVAEATISALGREPCSLALAFVRDRAMRELNRKFRGVNRTTDVLSFPTQDESSVANDEPTLAVQSHLGDIVISTDKALAQSAEAGHSLEREINELIIHGVLHLCGYDHETDRGEMNRLELKLRRRLLDRA